MSIIEEIGILAEETKELCAIAHKGLRTLHDEAAKSSHSLLAKRYKMEAQQVGAIFMAMACILIDAEERNISRCCPLLLERCKDQAEKDFPLMPEIRESAPEIITRLEKMISLSKNLFDLKNGGLREEIVAQ